MSGPSAPGDGRGRSAGLELARSDIGFSAAHFSVIGGRAERLHGHNYRVTLQAAGEVRHDGTVIDFNALKAALREVCAELDERTLLPAHSDVLEVDSSDAQVTVQHGAARYLFPRDDVRLLPIENTTCECLAAHLLGAVRQRLGAAAVRLRLGVEELPGQGAWVEE